MRMELYIHEFFPCTAAVARKVFPLIRRFAKDEDKEKLKQFLRIKAREHSGKVKAFSEKAESLTAKFRFLLRHAHPAVGCGVMVPFRIPSLHILRWADL